MVKRMNGDLEGNTLKIFLSEKSRKQYRKLENF